MLLSLLFCFCFCFLVGGGGCLFGFWFCFVLVVFAVVLFVFALLSRCSGRPLERKMHQQYKCSRLGSEPAWPSGKALGC